MIQLSQPSLPSTPKEMATGVGKDLKLKENNLISDIPGDLSSGDASLNEFMNELQLQMNATDNTLSSNTLSSLVSPTNTQQAKDSSLLTNKKQISDEILPQSFDPSITNEVEKLVAPKNSKLLLGTGLLGTAGMHQLMDKNQSEETLKDLAVPGSEKNENIFSSSEENLSFPVVDGKFLSNKDLQNFKPENIEKNILPGNDSHLLKNWMSTNESGFITSTDQVLPDNFLIKDNNSLELNKLRIPQTLEKASDLSFYSNPEIDKSLLTDDFLSQKNIFNKKVFSNPYGINPHSLTENKVGLKELKDGQVFLKDSIYPESSSVNSQQFILGLKADANVSEVSAPKNTTKVFDMNNIRSSDTNQILNQITDYIVQARSVKGPVVNMRINHDDLGLIDISVSKINNNQEMIAINIGTHSLDGKSFFQQYSKELFSHLSNAGLNVSDLKLEVSQQAARNDFDSNSQQGRNSSEGGQKQFGSEQNQRRHDSEKRQDLWKLLNKEAA